jgi:hypothetical protein
MSSKKPEDVGGPKGTLVELLLPIHLFWEVEGLMKQLDYLTSANEDPVLSSELYQKILRKVSRYAVMEKDRVLLQEKSNAAPG